MRRTKFFSHSPDVDVAKERADCRIRSSEDWINLLHRLEDIELDPTCVDDDPLLVPGKPHIRLHQENQEAMVYRIVGDTTEILIIAHVSGFNDPIGMCWSTIIAETLRRDKL
jgi:hypothetical protein